MLESRVMILNSYEFEADGGRLFVQEICITGTVKVRDKKLHVLTEDHCSQKKFSMFELLYKKKAMMKRVFRSNWNSNVELLIKVNNITCE